MERTVVILKPDCMARNLAGEVIRRFQESGFTLRACKMLRLSEELLCEHYAHLVTLPFFPEILAFMQSSPILALVLEGENCINRVRDLIGPTDPIEAKKGTIRGDLGQDRMRNIVHGSDSPETAAVELKRFFNENEVF